MDFLCSINTYSNYKSNAYRKSAHALRISYREANGKTMPSGFTEEM